MSKVLYILFNKFVEMSSEKIRTLVLKNVYHSLRLMAWADGKDNSIVRAFLEETYSIWLGLILSLIQTNPKTILKIKNYSMKILTVLIRDYANFTRESLPMILEPCWKYINLNLPIFIEVVCNGRKVIEDISRYEAYSTVISIAMYSMELFNTLINKSIIKSALQVGLKQTLSILISYLFIERQEENEKYCDEREYIIINEEDYVHKLRGKCLLVIKQLIDIYSDLCISTLMGCIKHLLTDKQQPNDFATFDFEMADMLNFAYETNSKDFYWKKCEGALLLIGYLNDDIVFYSKRCKDVTLEYVYKTLLSPSFMKYIISHKILLGRLLWNLSMVSEYLITDSTLAKNALLLGIRCLINEKSTPLKLSSLWVLVRYSSFIEWDNEKIKDDLMIAVKNINALIHVVSPYILSYPLEALKLFARDACDLLVHGCSQIFSTVLSLIEYTQDDEIEDTKLLEVMEILSRSNKKQFYELFWEKYQHVIIKCTDERKKNQVSLKIVTETLHSLIQYSSHVIPSQIIQFISKSIVTTEDPILLNSLTWIMRSLVFKYHSQIRALSLTPLIIDSCKYLLKPTLLENGLMHLGYLIIIIFNKLIPNIDTEILFEVIKKSYRARMPSVVQSLVLIFGKLILLHPKEILSFLTDTSFESRISLKILLDKWLLHQPLFRGKHTVSTTIYALAKLFELKDQRVETLRVITYNPSHSNMNSEVNAPFKILCTLVRYIDNEITKKIVVPNDILKNLNGKEEEEEPISEGKNDRVEMDNISDDNEEEENAPIKVKWEDLKNEEDYQVQLLDIEKNFEIKESKDKGLADVETGSTYYMSEMLAFDFDECADNEEMYEDDVSSIGEVKLPESMLDYVVKFLKDMSKNDSKYFELCAKHLLESDRALLKKYILNC